MSLNGSRTYAKDDAALRDPPRSPADNLIDICMLDFISIVRLSRVN